jgi:striatin 1/3/4
VEVNHQKKLIIFFIGECVQSVSGHLDAITSLDIDSTGNTMVSGGHDSSIRLWDLTSKTCIQEFSAHRRKGDEGVLSVKFHQSFPWMVSGGADGIVKIYHHGH